MAEKKEIMISIDPIMASKFSASTHVSRKYSSPYFYIIVWFRIRLQGRLRKHAQDEQQTQKDTGID